MSELLKYREFADQEELIGACAVLIGKEISRPGSFPFGIILTGGSTIQRVYIALYENSVTADRLCRVIVSDERHVPYSSVDSNYGRMRAVLEKCGLDESSVIKPDTALDLEQAANVFNDELAGFLACNPVIPLSVLGLGADGHAASLFSFDDVNRCAGRYAAAVRRESPPHRISLAPSVLGLPKRTVFLAAGVDKKSIVSEMRKNMSGQVAGNIVSGSEVVELWYAP